jgi:PAS domain S-box-containing protein
MSVLPGVVYQARFSADGTARIEYMSEAARWMLEIDPASAVDDITVFRSLIHPDDLEHFHRSLEQQRTSSGRWHLEYRLVLPSGRISWISSRAYVQATPDGGTIWRGFLTDITAQKLAENELNAERGRLELATRAGRVGAWDYDVRTGEIRWNDVMYEIHGVSPETYEPDGESNAQFLAHEDRTRVWEEFHRALDSGANSYSIDVTIVRPDGERRLTRSQAMILRDHTGAAIRVVGVEMDITEEKRAELAMAKARDAAEAADRAKSEFLATMSHEIRTPMNGILGYTALLKSSPVSAEQAEYLETVEVSGRRLLEIINDVLDVSRIEAGGMEVDFAPFPIRDCVRDVFEILRSVAAQKKIEYICEVDPDLPDGIVSDRGRLAQVLTNMLGNAVKFTEVGRVTLAVSACQEAADVWQWTFRISDTGPGISAEARAQIFRPFYQADSSLRRKHGGSGLGLAISSRLAGLLNGSLDVHSEVGRGSEFILRLRAAAIGNLASAEAPALPAHLPLMGLCVLVVEDNEINRRLCGMQLRRIGCQARFANDGVSAVRIFSMETFDVVLMDMQLPEMDGCEATMEIRKLESERGGKRTPIIAMTANARAEDRDRCLEAGMDDYLSKPLSQEALAATLKRWSGPSGSR